MGLAASAAQSRGENPGSRTTLRDAEDFLTCTGARVLLLSWLPPLVGGARRPAAAEGGGRRALPAFGRGGCSWFVGWAPVGRRRGTEGGGIREGVFVLVVAGGCCFS